MTDSAAQLQRIVQLVAELSRREREGAPAIALGEVAAQLGVAPDDVARDLRTLTAVSDDAEHDWLGSLSVIQEGDLIALSSRGPFQRPVRLTPDELLAVQLGLAADGAAATLSRELARLLDAGEVVSRISVHETAGPDEMAVVDLARGAARERRCLEIRYAGSGDTEPSTRCVEVHEVTRAEGKFYLVSWCRTAGGPRYFRADRVLAARVLADPFMPRDAVRTPESAELFAAEPGRTDEVTVRFAPAVARWVSERYPGARSAADGSVLVTFAVGDPAWLVRTVLQYGPDAEVVGPPAYRVLLRAACRAG